RASDGAPPARRRDLHGPRPGRGRARDARTRAARADGAARRDPRAGGAARAPPREARAGSGGAPAAPRGPPPGRVMAASVTASGALTSARTVRDVMTSIVKSLGRNDRLSLVGDVMRAARIRHVPIVDQEGELCGIVSQRDLFRGALATALGY